MFDKDKVFSFLEGISGTIIIWLPNMLNVKLFDDCSPYLTNIEAYLKIFFTLAIGSVTLWRLLKKKK